MAVTAVTRVSLASSCYELSLRGCLLQDLFVSFSRAPGSQEEEDFVCRLGEIQVRRPGRLVLVRGSAEASVPTPGRENAPS